MVVCCVVLAVVDCGCLLCGADCGCLLCGAGSVRSMAELLQEMNVELQPSCSRAHQLLSLHQHALMVG